MPKVELERKYNLIIPHLKYNSLICAIPKTWKRILKTDSNCLNYMTFKEAKVNVNEQKVQICEVNTKDFYWHIINKKALRPTSEETWEKEVGLKFDEHDWEYTYINPYSLTRDSKIISFEYKVTHRILACKSKLYTWNIKINNICDTCNTDIDNIEHHLVACPETLSFWNYLFGWFKSVTQTFFPTDTYDIIFGLPNPNNLDLIRHLNYLLLHGIWYIYKCKQAKVRPEIYEYLIKIKRNLEDKKESMTINGKLPKYIKLWEPLLELM
jgi:hypothetical protein